MRADNDGPVDEEIQGLREGLGRRRSPQVGDEGESEEKHDGQEEHAIARGPRGVVLAVGSIRGLNADAL